VSTSSTPTPFTFREHFALISRFADELRDAALLALEEEAVLVAVQGIYHAE
jgi:hypothetical protein